MGVSGLLGLLKSIHKPCHLRDFRGKTLAVDAYGWLHRGAVACAIELATDKPTTKILDFCMHRVRMLLHFGVTPYIVFDGDRLPSKAATERGRHERRKEARTNGLEYLRVGKTPLAYQELQKAVDITPEIARMFIEALKASNVRYVVAPYEADSQMVYLEQTKVVDGIVSEDSDLLVFGAKKLLTKLDQYGECILIDREHFTRCREVNLTGWTLEEFRTMAILNGCDYLDGIARMGLRTAHRLVRKYKSIDRVLRGIMLENKLRLPADYLQSFIEAERTFLYQWVFCPATERLVHFKDLPRSITVEDMPYIGGYIEPEIAVQVAEGELDPTTKERILLTSQQWGSVQKHLRMTEVHRIGTRPVAVTVQPSKDTPSKSIDTFFKPKRAPLAELDPNEFRKSESQQRLVDADRNEGWQSQRTPSDSRPPMPQRSYTAPVRPVDEPNPPKRRRLCGDSPSKKAVQTERSKFFGGKPALHKSPPRISKSRRKINQLDFNIFSDESIEGAMAEFPNADTTNAPPRKAAKLKVFCDDDDAAQQQQVKVNEATEASLPQARQTALVSDETAEHGDAASPFTAALHQQTREFTKRSSLQAFALSNSPATSTSHDGLSSPSHQPRNPRRTTAPAGAKFSLQRQRNQVIGLQTPAKPSTAPKAVPHDDVIWESPPTQQRTGNDLQSTAASLKFSTPGWLPEDSGYASQLDAVVPKGSEDWLVQASDSEIGSSRRNSEQEEVCVAGSSPLQHQKVRPVLDLKRFTYGA